MGFGTYTSHIRLSTVHGKLRWTAFSSILTSYDIVIKLFRPRHTAWKTTFFNHWTRNKQVTCMFVPPIREIELQKKHHPTKILSRSPNLKKKITLIFAHYIKGHTILSCYWLLWPFLFAKEKLNTHNN